MSNYDFTKIQPLAFQALAQALAVKAFGAGTKVFGDGPDGAREGSFDGPAKITSHEHEWNGYGIIQAKCRQSPLRDHRDADWLVSQLEADLRKFTDKSRRLRKPQYYVVVTNISLSGVHKPRAAKGKAPAKGGKEKLDEFMAVWKKKIGLKGWIVWDAAQLRALLDDAADIRTSYLPWITAGDVLTAALDRLKSPQLSKLIPLILARELKAERDIRRKEARQNTDQAIALHDVFVDLPVSVPNIDDSSRKLPSRSPKPKPKVAQELLQRASEKLDPTTLFELDASRDLPAPQRNRIVILGGPGQGKSTIGQFLAQIYRSQALLHRGQDTALESREIASAVNRASLEQSLSTSFPTRFPLRIELPVFADDLERCHRDKRELSILEYAAHRFSLRTDVKIDSADMRGWLGAHPWIIILDGLDEVPASGNRVPVLAAITSLWDDIHQAGADVLVVVTTRQQGYSNDLDSKHWSHWTLAELSPSDAMRFAQQQAVALVADEERRTTILSRLEIASQDDTTAPLMTTPLQVAMLFALAEVNDNIPSDRWTLFNRHYEVIRDREASKSGKRASLVTEHKPIIDEIHHDAGFILHARAEIAGSANAYLTPTEFADLVENKLREERHSDADIASLRKELSEIATDRLVLLNARVEGRIAFDVRSLQEFMAAARIMSGREASITERLRKVVARSHWRHVVRIAISKIFGTDLRHLRQDVIALCQTINSPAYSFGDGTHLAGARLALELLNDRIVARQPGYQVQLLECALKVLELGATEFDDGLAEHYSTNTAKTYWEAIASASNSERLAYRAAALRLCVALGKFDFHQAAEMAERLLPESHSELIKLVRAAAAPVLFPEVLARTKRALQDLGYHATYQFCKSAGDGEASWQNDEMLPLARDLVIDKHPTYHDHSIEVALQLSDAHETSDRTAVSFLLRPMFSDSPPGEVPSGDQWRISQAINAFNLQPSAAGLARALRLFSGADLETIHRSPLPWPLQAAIIPASTPHDLLAFAIEAELGLYGDADDWLAAEERWREVGISASDFSAWQGGRILHKHISKEGAPPTSICSASPADVELTVPALTSIVASLPKNQCGLTLVGSVLFYLTVARRTFKLDGQAITQLMDPWIEMATERQFRWGYEVLGQLDITFWENHDFLHLAHRYGEKFKIGITYRREDDFDEGPLRAFNRNPGLRGLLGHVVEAALATKATAPLNIAIDSSAHQKLPGDSEAIKNHVTLLKLICRTWSLDQTAQFAQELTDASIHVEALRTALERVCVPGDDIGDSLLCALHLKNRDHDLDSTEIISVFLHRQLYGRQSELASNETAKDLGLPSASSLAFA